MKELEQYREATENLSTIDFLRWAIEVFGKEKLLLASSFSIEDQVLTWMLHSIEPKARIFTLDTGRLFNETYDVMDHTALKYGINYEVGFPEASQISSIVGKKGPNFFLTSVEDRKECCRIRKTEPLTKILSTGDCWITGLRRDQSVTRTELHRVEWDSQWGLWKINPLADWSEDDVWQCIERERIPYNALQKKGFLSIGCSCCTRAVKEGEDIRAGRWWWENPEHKECGLHKSH